MQRRYAEAAPLYKRAFAIYEKARGAEHPYVAISLVNLARLYSAQGRYAQAEPLYKRALGIMEKALGIDHPNFTTIRRSLQKLQQSKAVPADVCRDNQTGPGDR